MVGINISPETSQLLVFPFEPAPILTYITTHVLINHIIYFENQNICIKVWLCQGIKLPHPCLIFIELRIYGRQLKNIALTDHIRQLKNITLIDAYLAYKVLTDI